MARSSYKNYFSVYLGIPLEDAITRGTQIRQEGIFANIGYYKNLALISPDEKQRASCGAMEQLALNLEPRSAYYQRGVAVLDFTSLYPSVVIANNICYSTVLGG